MTDHSAVPQPLPNRWQQYRCNEVLAPHPNRAILNKVCLEETTRVAIFYICLRCSTTPPAFADLIHSRMLHSDPFAYFFLLNMFIDHHTVKITLFNT